MLTLGETALRDTGAGLVRVLIGEMREETLVMRAVTEMWGMEKREGLERGGE